MSFEEYLTQKKIDFLKFKETEPDRYLEWENIFLQISQRSFTIQKLNLINFIRRRFPFKEEFINHETNTSNEKSPEIPQSAPKGAARPMFKRKLS